MSHVPPGSESRGVAWRRRFSYAVAAAIGVLLLVAGRAFLTIPGLLGGAAAGATVYWFEYEFWNYSPGLGRHVFQIAVAVSAVLVFWLGILFVTSWTTAADLATGFFGLVAGHWLAHYAR